ncbi:MAG: tRNA(Ile)-lysidine synthetase, partial [Chloroflexi bacterium]|nr:tRNA(Ile)-lysidine synthetase [Chloroflexota bacterium]
SPFPIPPAPPLLTTSRAAIEAYCQDHALTPTHDESNQDTRFLRNRIRHELLPLLETYNLQIRGRILDLAELVTADEALLRAWQEELRRSLSTCRMGTG